MATTIKERPILFSAPMVLAILEGRKTQTRRVIKPQPEYVTSLGFFIPQPNASGSCAHFHHIDKRGIHSKETTTRCPYGMPGYRLWVREICHAEELKSGRDGVRYLADNKFIPIENTQCASEKWGKLASYGMKKSGRPECRKVPSIHMPRWASRINLEITSIRVERLQDISETDAISEGLQGITKDGNLIKYGIPDKDGFPGTDDLGWPWIDYKADPRKAYRLLWELINGIKSWDANPWVWVIEFKRL